MELIYEGVFAVDTFFFLSGLLVAVISLRGLQNTICFQLVSYIYIFITELREN